jgi:hypothetical protein
VGLFLVAAQQLDVRTLRDDSAFAAHAHPNKPVRRETQRGPTAPAIGHARLNGPR